MQIPSQPQPHRGLLPPGQLFARTRAAFPSTAASLPTAPTAAGPVQSPGPQLTSVAYFERHHRTVAQQQAQAGAHPGDLIAGHKKDVVITPRLDQKPQSVAIYGWHQPNGKAIQPLSTIHENTYADYSHGVRLVGSTLSINGTPYSTTEVLRHPQWSRLLSDEGIVQNPRAVRP